MSKDVNKTEQPPEEHEGSVKEKLQEKLYELKDSETVTEIYKYTLTNRFESILIVLVVFGVVLTWFNAPAGLGLIGLLLGMYFTDDIPTILYKLKEYYQTHGWFKIVLIGGALLSLLMTTWTFVVGIAAAVGVKSVIRMFRKKSEL
ncbi:MAG: hypothetical protein HN411_01240 [Waddliaceae bacterium]|jgi:hypothetical protein|nr:hypothetical protein [Waddliaceae bacterium]MBT3579622.1 hypothetical protein [Waddliaceae bacterium]MBT4444612.1 hypothetical protein [Waddliaceae bacterium]MBT6928133.1 hypothetical protein [Waddliaceae bacterium]MBT7264695.1 hypothetical protein [Waddliaceae bacterium]